MFQVLACAVARVASIGFEEQADRARHDLPDGQPTTRLGDQHLELGVGLEGGDLGEWEVVHHSGS
jgi:hypothetical protein